MSDHEIIINPPPVYQLVEQPLHWKDQIVKTAIEGIFLVAVGWKFWKAISAMDQIKSKKARKNV